MVAGLHLVEKVLRIVEILICISDKLHSSVLVYLFRHPSWDDKSVFSMCAQFRSYPLCEPFSRDTIL